MYEIVFDESLSGSMKLALCRQKRNSGDRVIDLSFDLDRGPIRDGVLNPEKRKLFIEKYDGRSVCDCDDHGQQEAAWIDWQRELDRMYELAAKGASFRIWYSDLPYALCGLYFVCHALQRVNCGIYTVKLPELVVTGESIVQYRDWSEVGADELLRFTDKQHLLTPEEIRFYAGIWSELMEQNGPLRVTLNGKVVTAGEDFYDSLLVRNMPKGIFSTGLWLSKVWDLVSGAQEDVLLSRAEALIDAGKVEIVEEGEEFVWSRRMKRPEELIEIRQGRPEECGQTEELLRKAFGDPCVSDCRESYVAHQLRQSEGFIPELDLVRLRNGRLVGSVMCGHGKIISRDGQETAVICFGPMAVLPEDQKNGMGETLLREAMKRAGDMGYRLAVVLGDPQYYRRFGFRYAENYDVGISSETFADCLLMVDLSGEEIDVLDGGVFAWDAAFASDEDEGASEGFDREIPAFPIMTERTRSRKEPRREDREIFEIVCRSEAEIY